MPSGQTVPLIMSDVSTSVTVQICVNLEHSVYLDIRENTVSFAFRTDIAYDLIHFDHRKSDWLLDPVQHLFFLQKMIVQFLSQVFRVLASAEKVVFLGQLENVHVRHLSALLILRGEVIRFFGTYPDFKKTNQIHPPGIEPGSLRWKRRILPLNYRCCCDVREVGFEPTRITPRDLKTRALNQALLSPHYSHTQ